MKKTALVQIILLLLLGNFLVASDIDPGEKTLRLELLIDEVTANNPRVQAARDEWLAALEKIPQSRAFPDPRMSFGVFGQSVETRLGPQRTTLSVSQTFPFFGKLSLKAKIEEFGAAVIQEKYREAVSEVELRVKEAFYSLYWYEKSLEVSQREKDVLKRLTEIALKKYETGTASQQDVLKAQVELTKLSDRILQLRQNQRAAATELAFLMNRPSDDILAPVEMPIISDLPLSRDEVFDAAIANRPEIKAVENLVQKAEETLRLEKKNSLPDLTLMVSYIDVGSGTTNQVDDGCDAWMGAVGINIPVWGKKLKAAENESALHLKASRQQYNNLKNQTYSRLSVLFSEYQSIEEQISLYENSLIPLAEQALKASEASYIAGKDDFLDLIESERMVFLVKTGFYNAESARGKILSQIERITGKNLFHFQSPRSVEMLSSDATGMK